MTERWLLLTGKLAEGSLRRVLDQITDREREFEVRNLGVNVAALMSSDLIRRRLKDYRDFDRVLVPGLCVGDLDALSTDLGVAVARGPVDLKDLPAFLGHGGRQVDLSRYDIRIFAEICDAPFRDIDSILERAAYYTANGADVIDVGCIPETPFPHLEEAVQALKQSGYLVSVDTLNPDDLLRGGHAGADFLLSLKPSTLWIAEEVASIPILIPETPNNQTSLYRSIEQMLEAGRPFYADSILEPVHFGLTESIVRYRNLRRRFPDIEVLMGIGNLSELTDADTGGVNAMFLGIMSELRLTAILTTEVSPHARSCVRELDRGRRMMFAAREDSSLPKGYDDSLTMLHDRRPFTYTAEEVAEFATEVRDPNYRIQVTESGVHVYNRDGELVGVDPYELFPKLDEIQNDPGHAFYMGMELARAQIAWQLGKRYIQDRELTWGAALPAEDMAARLAEFEGSKSTVKASRRRKPGGKKNPAPSATNTPNDS